MEVVRLELHHEQLTAFTGIYVYRVRGEESQPLFAREIGQPWLVPVYLQKGLTQVLATAAHLGVFDPSDLPG